MTVTVWKAAWWESPDGGSEKAWKWKWSSWTCCCWRRVLHADVSVWDEWAQIVGLSVCRSCTCVRFRSWPGILSWWRTSSSCSDGLRSCTARKALRTLDIMTTYSAVFVGYSSRLFAVFPFIRDICVFQLRRGEGEQEEAGPSAVQTLQTYRCLPAAPWGLQRLRRKYDAHRYLHTHTHTQIWVIKAVIFKHTHSQSKCKHSCNLRSGYTNHWSTHPEHNTHTHLRFGLLTRILRTYPIVHLQFHK